jgi:DNA polymerase-3 subunit alpha (Gram-positive type)
MAKPSFNEIFGSYLNEELNAAFKNSVIEHCSLDVHTRALELELNSKEYINRDIMLTASSTLKAVLKAESCSITYKFDPTAFCKAACADVAAEIKLKNAALNGYFAEADYTLSESEVKITLKHGGYKTICELNAENLFKAAVKSKFGLDITVLFDGQLDDVAIELPTPEPVAPRAPKAEKPKSESPKTEIKFEKREEKPQNGIVYLDDPKLFYGRKIESNTKPMIEVTGDDSEICCWGEVFETEVRNINTKRGESNILTFSFSDYTNSLTASMFVDPKRMGEVAPVKKGNFILVNGIYEFDNYKKDFIVKPKSMALLQKYTESDDYEGEKRVELHCHTNMSAKDAVTSAGDIIIRHLNGDTRRLLLPTTALYKPILRRQRQ